MNGTTNKEQLQPHGKQIPRRQCIPILYTKGTHYDVGFDMVSEMMIISHVTPILQYISVIMNIYIFIKS